MTNSPRLIKKCGKTGFGGAKNDLGINFLDLFFKLNQGLEVTDGPRIEFLESREGDLPAKKCRIVCGQVWEHIDVIVFQSKQRHWVSGLWKEFRTQHKRSPFVK